MHRSRILVPLATVLALVSVPLTASASSPGYGPGAPGIGDPYYPTDGNGGYDVQSYDLAIRYSPATDELVGTARIAARATQNLSGFDLDLAGLTVRSIVVDGRAAGWTRAGSELIVTPAKKLPAGTPFTAVIRYDGFPQALEEFGLSGFIPTDDGALVAGQPHVASSWFPVNDHPADKAVYHLAITVPEGVTAVGNGALTSRQTAGGWTTWVWDAPEPMASYLVTATMGVFDLTTWRYGAKRGWDAIDPALSTPLVAPRTGTRYAFTGRGDSTWTRLTRTIPVPAAGGRLTFWVGRDTEPEFDFFAVEARHAGGTDWTTLPDLNGHTSGSVGFACPQWLEDHPFIAHYETASGDTCTPVGTSGRWNAASGASDGWEQWSVDLGPYAGTSVELSLAYVTDFNFTLDGVFVDDVTVPGGPGSTSFEADGDVLDGWAVTGPPAGSPGNATQWSVGDPGAAPSMADDIRASFARQGEILDVLSANFGPYPFSTVGGIVDNVPALGFALENQTRPIYSPGFFGSGPNYFVIAHELAHQWYGDSLAVKRWQEIWLNEGFATYAEWLWGQHEGFFTPQDVFDFFMNEFPAEDPFWDFTIGDPGPDHLFDGQVYDRGGLTLQALRLTVGDDAFFRILRRWAAQNRGGNVTTAQFIALAEQVSGRQLDAFFDAWLYSPTKPPLPAGVSAATARVRASSAVAHAIADWRATANKYHRTR